jgi:hypothetical protein
MPDLTASHDAPRALADTLHRDGFVHLAAPALRDLVGWSAQDWEAFAASWNGLGPDGYMADGGRYRLRRHGAFEARGQAMTAKPHQPHYQSRDYNPLNGGVQRWFEPTQPAVAQGAIMRGIVAALTPVFAALDGRGGEAPWHGEAHQFRIETSREEIGQPTPEGFHRDGVDWVLVMLVARRNVVEGTTQIADLAGHGLGRFTLVEPGDAVLLDDRRIMHGVTPIHAIEEAQPAFRDALVVTWMAQD